MDRKLWERLAIGVLVILFGIMGWLGKTTWSEINDLWEKKLNKEVYYQDKETQKRDVAERDTRLNGSLMAINENINYLIRLHVKGNKGKE